MPPCGGQALKWLISPFLTLKAVSLERGEVTGEPSRLSGGPSGSTEWAAGPRRVHALLEQEQTRPLFFQTLLSTAGLVGRDRIPSRSWGSFE